MFLIIWVLVHSPASRNYTCCSLVSLINFSYPNNSLCIFHQVDTRTLLKQSVAAIRLLLCSVIQLAPNHKQLPPATLSVLMKKQNCFWQVLYNTRQNIVRNTNSRNAGKKLTHPAGGEELWLGNNPSQEAAFIQQMISFLRLALKWAQRDPGPTPSSQEGSTGEFLAPVLSGSATSTPSPGARSSLQAMTEQFPYTPLTFRNKSHSFNRSCSWALRFLMKKISSSPPLCHPNTAFQLLNSSFSILSTFS